jgi:hypothetical protein
VSDPAFPIVRSSKSEDVWSGLTKREYFAAMCLQGLLSTLTIERDAHSKILAETAVLHADALIKELEREQEQ